MVSHDLTKVCPPRLQSLGHARKTLLRLAPR